MTFRYRYVNFGTSFKSATGMRAADNNESDPAALYENELVLDVGSICWGCDGEPLAVLDHHFAHQYQFPSASSAVLHKASLIDQKLGRPLNDVIWLVTHKQPDFDAFCSMFLARSIIEHNIPAAWGEYGLHPEGWQDVNDPKAREQRIDWFEPKLDGVPAQFQWPLLLASYAAHTDNGRRISCPKHRALHSVLYAAICRGRDYSNPTSGAIQFFDEVRETIETKGLNPLFDSVLEHSVQFEPELRLLDGEIETYQRDIQRARKAIVHLQKSSVPFEEFYAPVCNIPLLNPDRTTRSEHLDVPNQTRSQVDGVYIRDPECLLFKEWARTDTENPSMRAGFTFTAVAYSHGRPNASLNGTDYYFAIDPERADRRHLYTLWARLQTADIEAVLKPEASQLKGLLDASEDRARNTSERTICRHGFEERAGAYKALFGDPWFDGSNYECTIVATPNRGTHLGTPGIRGDLLDDPVAAIVRQELEYTVYASEDSTQPAEISILDLSASGICEDRSPENYPIIDAGRPVDPAPRGYFRFGKIKLNDSVDIRSGSMAKQIGETLWRFLNGEVDGGTPTDFLNRHLLISRNWLGVWSRAGIVIAFKPSAEARARAIEAEFRELVVLSRGVESFIGEASQSSEDAVRVGEALTLAAARATRTLNLPDNRALCRFFDALRLGELLNSLRDLNLAAVERERRAKLASQAAELARHTATVAEVQIKVEWLEIVIVGFYATELANIIVEHLGPKDPTGGLIVILAAGFLSMLLALLALKPWKHAANSKQP